MAHRIFADRPSPRGDAPSDPTSAERAAVDVTRAVQDPAGTPEARVSSAADALEATLAAMRAEAERPPPWLVQPQPNGIGRSALRSAGPPPAPASSAVDAARTLIGGLERQISRLESENQRKAGEIAGLVASIAARRTEIEAEYERKRRIGIVGALFGAPMVGFASLLMMQNDDQRLRQLDAQLGTARARQAEITRELADYGGIKDRVTARLADLERAEAALERAEGAPTDGLPTRLEGLARSLELFSRSSLLVANLEAQIAILSELRDSARALGLRLDGVLEELRAAATRAASDAEASRRELGQLLWIVAADDPDAAARAWVTRALEGRVRGEVERAIGALIQADRLPPELARSLIQRLASALLG